MAEEWVRSAHNKFDAESQSRCEVEKALSTANHEKMQPVEKLKATESARQSVEVRLKNAKVLVEKQRINSSTLHKLTLPPRRQRF